MPTTTTERARRHVSKECGNDVASEAWRVTAKDRGRGCERISRMRAVRPNYVLRSGEAQPRTRARAARRACPGLSLAPVTSLATRRSASTALGDARPSVLRSDLASLPLSRGRDPPISTMRPTLCVARLITTLLARLIQWNSTGPCLACKNGVREQHSAPELIQRKNVIPGQLHFLASSIEEARSRTKRPRMRCSPRLFHHRNELDPRFARGDSADSPLQATNSP